MSYAISSVSILSVLALAIVCRATPVKNEGSNRIAHGLYANNLQFPYAVSIQLTTNTSNVATRGHKCGGVLISLQEVLTAASCMFEWNDDGTRIPIVYANYRVFGGAHILTNDTSPDNYRNIADVNVHSNYQGIPSYLNDIALIYLTTPFDNTTVVPLSLPTADYDPADFTDCVVAGWGATASDVNTPSVVQKFANNMFIYNHQLCAAVYNSQYQLPNIFPSMICATSYDIVTVGCNGDQGNALVCGSNNTLTGILALHDNCVGTSLPEIYTRVSDYVGWIRPASGTTRFTAGGSVLLFLSLTMTFFNFLSF